MCKGGVQYHENGGLLLYTSYNEPLYVPSPAGSEKYTPKDYSPPRPNHGPNPTHLVSVLCVLRVFHLKVKLHIKGPHNTVHVYPSYCHVNDTVQKRLVKAASPTTYRTRGISVMLFLPLTGTVSMDQGKSCGVPTVYQKSNVYQIIRDDVMWYNTPNKERNRYF